MRLGYLLTQIVTFIFAVVETILGLRFILKLFGANSSASFVSWVYETSSQLLRPFFGIFPAPRLEGRFVLEFSTLFAILVYGLIAYGLYALITALTPAPPAVVKTTKRRRATA